MILRKRLLSFILTIMMCITGVLSASTVSVEAKATPKLSAKTVTVVKGGKQTIKLKNGKGNWSIQGNGVAKIKSKTRTSVTITPLKAGSTIVKCKVGEKVLKCKVKVLNNIVGTVDEMYFPAVIVGRTYKESFTLPQGVKYKGKEYDESIGKLTVKAEPNTATGETKLTLTTKAYKPGRFNFNLYYQEGEKDVYEEAHYYFINGFRGKAKVKRTDANYKKWRKKTISSMVDADMSTWEIVNALGCLISSGKYGTKGGVSAKQLWYGGNGTCVSGAQMMDDFMKDLGVISKVKFMGNKGGAVDIYGYSIMYMSQHKNTWIWLGGKRYELNAQPGGMWPIGTVRR